jgi:hypothetical protein
MQGLGDELLPGREQLFMPHSDANIVLVTRWLAPAQYVQCTDPLLISTYNLPCRSFRKAGAGYEGKASATPHASDVLAYD